MTFKEQLRSDVNAVFMNNHEFSDIHIINGKEMSVLIDNAELLERAKITGIAATDGIYSANILIFVASTDYGAKPSIGSLLTLDNRPFKVVNCTDEDGMYSIELKASRI